MAFQYNQSLPQRSGESIPQPQEEIGYYGSYILHYRQEQDAPAGELPGQRFILQAVSGEQPQQVFSSFEQVMNFLLDELLLES
jgi:hypothetical protein